MKYKDSKHPSYSTLTATIPVRFPIMKLSEAAGATTIIFQHVPRQRRLFETRQKRQADYGAVNRFRAAFFNLDLDFDISAAAQSFWGSPA